jgi:hypothetical protein
MLVREHFVGRLQHGNKIRDQGVDGEERHAALAFGRLAAGEGAS